MDLQNGQNGEQQESDFIKETQQPMAKEPGMNQSQSTCQDWQPDGSTNGNWQSEGSTNTNWQTTGNPNGNWQPDGNTNGNWQSEGSTNTNWQTTGNPNGNWQPDGSTNGNWQPTGNPNTNWSQQGSQSDGYTNRQQYGAYQQQGNYQQAPMHTKTPAKKVKTQQEKKRTKTISIIVVVLVVALLLGLGGGVAGVYIANGIIKSRTGMEKIQEKLEGKLDEISQDEDLEGAIEDTLDKLKGDPEQITETGSSSAHTVAEIAEIGMPSVVAITNKGEMEVRSLFGTYVQEAESSGSGVIIGKSDEELLIATNYHVIEGAEHLSVVFSYQEDYENIDDIDVISAKVKDYDAGKDLAVIALQLEDLSQDNMDHISIATIGDSDKLVLGEQIVAIGNALGYGQSVTGGVVSALSRTVTMTSAAGIYISNDYLQVDAAINPGNSGGALFNMYGELVGINSAKVSSAGVEGMGYSIPISAVIEELNGMMTNEVREILPEKERGYLGIQGTNVTSGISSEYNLPVGAYVSAVNADSPAEKAGLEKGMIITGMNDKKVTSMDDLKDQLSRFRPGETVVLKVQVLDEEAETYQEKECTVTLASYESVGFNETELQEKGPQTQPFTIDDLFELFRSY